MNSAQPPVRSGAQHAEGAVLGVGELAGHPHDAFQHAVEVEIAGDADDGVQKAASRSWVSITSPTRVKSSESRSSKRARPRGAMAAEGPRFSSSTPVTPSRSGRLGQIQEVHHIRCAQSARGMTSAERTGNSHQKLRIARTT